MKKLYLFAFVSVVLCGCTPAEIAVMQNPKTGEVAQCQPDARLRDWEPWEYDNQLRQCISGYKAAGWERIDNKETAGQ